MCTHTHIHAKKNNPFHAYRLHIFIYLSCMYAFDEVCVYVCIQIVLQKEVAFMNIFKTFAKKKKTLPQQKPGWYQFTQ